MIKYLIFLYILFASQLAFAKEKIQIGVIFDGKSNEQHQVITKLRNELAILLGSKYDISISANKILFSDWSLKN